MNEFITACKNKDLDELKKLRDLDESARLGFLYILLEYPEAISVVLQNRILTSKETVEILDTILTFYCKEHVENIDLILGCEDLYPEILEYRNSMLNSLIVAFFELDEGTFSRFFHKLVEIGYDPNTTSKTTGETYFEMLFKTEYFELILDCIERYKCTINQYCIHELFSIQACQKKVETIQRFTSFFRELYNRGLVELQYEYEGRNLSFYIENHDWKQFFLDIDFPEAVGKPDTEYFADYVDSPVYMWLFKNRYKKSFTQDDIAEFKNLLDIYGSIASVIFQGSIWGYDGRFF